MSKPPIHIDGIVGGDVTGGDKTVNQRAGGDIVGRDKITQAAPPIGIAALHQLPSPPAGFTGRAAELAVLRTAVRDEGISICGLRGLGGVGKTALALVLANELAKDYPDAQIFLNLQGVTQPLTAEAVMAHVIRAYKPVEKLPDDPAQLAAAYRSVLSGQRALLLFDNAANAEQVRPLLPPPGCLMLVTSRQKFALPGLRRINLDSLPPGDAEALVLKLADRIGGYAPKLAQLCGYLPLALTLAGSALAEREDLEPDKYMGRLQHTRLAVLDEVEASLVLSYDLLSPELQELWRVLSVFPSDFDAAAAGAVWSLEPDPAGDRLSDLLRFSLLDFDKQTRRYRLHDLARDFARLRISDAERDATCELHAKYFSRVTMAAGIMFEQGGDTGLRGLALFDQEQANILVGQNWTISHHRDNNLAANMISAYAGSGLLLSLRLPARERKRLSETAVATAHLDGNRKAEATLLLGLGMANLDFGDAQWAIVYFEVCYEIAHELGQHRIEGQALNNLGLAYDQAGEPRKGIDYLQKSLAIARQIGDRVGEGNAYWNKALALDDIYDRVAAITNGETALQLFEQIESPAAEKVRRKLAEWKGS